MKKIFTFFIIILIVLSAAAVYLIDHKDHSNSKNDTAVESKLSISFSMKYDIKLKNKSLIPKSIVIQEPIKLSELIKESEYSNIFNYFIYNQNLFVSGGEIVELYPTNSVALERVMFKTVDKDFLLSRGVTEYAVNKTLEVFKREINFEIAYQKLESTYKRSKKNMEFYEKAIKKLIF